MKSAIHSKEKRGLVVNELFAERFITGLQNWNWAMAATGYSGVMPSIFPEEDLHQIKTPVLMLIGDQDKLDPPKVLERAERVIPQIQGEIIPNAGYFLSMEQSELADIRILEFLRT